MTTHTMTLQEIIEDIHAMTKDCEVYERKYGVLSETFYESYIQGEEPEHEDYPNAKDFPDFRKYIFCSIV